MNNFLRNTCLPNNFMKNTKKGALALIATSALFVLSTAPVKAGYGGLWGYLNSSEYIYKCTQTENRTSDFFYSGPNSNKDPLAISFCNRGAYTIDTAKLKIWRKSDEAWRKDPWVLVYEDKISSNFDIGKGVYWSGNALNPGAEYKFKVIYKIASGEKKACTKKIESIKNGILWHAFSTGTTYDNNRCRTTKFEK